MKMYKTTKLLMLAFFFGAFFIGINAYAWKMLDFPISPTGSYTNRDVLEGQIKTLDLETMEITFEKCELIGKEPLRLTKDSVCYKGDEKTDIVSVKGGTIFQKDDKISFDNLKAGDYIKCNYEIKDGKFWARRIVLTASYRKME